MNKEFNFSIAAGGTISARLLTLGIVDFSSATNYIRQLPYKRNIHKETPCVVLDEACGTCSTKHILLKLLAEENKQPAVRLMLGIYKMSAFNTKPVKKILEKYQLDYIPEAHNYLRIGNEIVDVTKPGFTISSFTHDILVEEEITPAQVIHHKVAKHQAFLQEWLHVQKHVPYQLADLWTIREHCIDALAQV
jgi:hypothetical protein